MSKPSASVILTTYNQPRLLDLALSGYARQSCDDFEIVIADDGSGPETRALIEAHAARLPLPVRHVWQEDRGFRKAQICNWAALESQGTHLVFSDGDCIPSRTFVAEHLAARRARTYIVGGHLRLDEDFTNRLRAEQVAAGAVEASVTRAQSAELWWTHLKSLAYIALNKRRKPKFYGLNFSLDRDSFFAVNGFDATYQDCGREDSDLRNRLQIAGVRARSLWHRARVFHLYHGPHLTRHDWDGVAAYYNRRDLNPVAPQGLRELREEGAAAASS